MAVSIRAAAGRLLVVWLVAFTLAGISCGGSPTAPTRPDPPIGPTPLSLACPPSVTAPTVGGAAVPVTFATPAATGGQAPVNITCSRQSGSMFPLGATPVQCTATDALVATASCAFTVTVATVPQLSRTRFLAFGDSLTEGEVTVPSSTSARDPFSFVLRIVPEASYPSRLLALLRTRYTAQVSTINVVNSGRSSEWAEDGARRLPGVMATLQPEVILLLEGANELSALGTAGVSRAAIAIDTMAREGRNRGARVFVATLPPTRPTGSSTVPLATIDLLNNRIRATASGEGAVLVDLYAALSADVNRFIGIDGLHPTEAGYARMAEVFFDAIRVTLEVR